MIKDLVKVLTTVFLATLITFPFTSIIADLLIVLWPPSLMNTIIITLVRYIGFFFGIGVVMFIYNGAQARQVSYGPQNPYTGGR